MKESKVK